MLALALLALLHPMLTSGLRRIPGDLGDARLDNYVLEHSFLWVAGRPDHASFWDPPIFYPERNVASITYNLDAMFAQRLLRGGRPRRRPERRRMRVESRPSNG